MVNYEIADGTDLYTEIVEENQNYLDDSKNLY